MSSSMASCSPACSLAQPQLRHPMRLSQSRADFAIAAKRGKRGQGSSNSGNGLGLLQIEPDGSNMWRLTAAVDSIESGGVGSPVLICGMRCCNVATARPTVKTPDTSPHVGPYW